MTTPPPPWEAHPPLPDDEFGPEDSTRRIVGPVPAEDLDEDTGPIRVEIPADGVTRTIALDTPDAGVTRVSGVSASAATQYGALPPMGYSEPDATASPTVYAQLPPEIVRAQQRPEAVYTRRLPEPAMRPPQPEPVLPSRPEDTYAGRFTAPLSVDPRAVPLRRNTGQPVLIAATVAAVVLAGLAAWWLWPSGDDEQQAADPSTSATPTVDAEANAQLMGLLPAGYSSEACEAAEAPEGASAEVTCTKNADTGGPASATYTLMEDEDALKAAMDRVIEDARVVNCPGRIQSPGPWRRNASPKEVAGTLVCGMPGGQPQIAWTTDSTLVLNVVRADPEGPALDQLFTWWQSHS